MFHTLAFSNANALIGTQGAARSLPAWTQTYRALDHGAAKSACNNSRRITRFPSAIQEFASHFLEMQDKRHSADYDPNARFTKEGVLNDIDLTVEAIRKFDRTPIKDRRAFGALVLFKDRK